MPAWLQVLAAVVFGLALLFVGGVVVWENWLKPSPIPRSWRHEGPKPVGADRALEVLRPLCPELRRWGGTVVWRTAPWPAGYDSPREMEGGQVLSYEEQKIAALSIAYMVHEIDHLRRGSAEESTDGWVQRAQAEVLRVLSSSP